MLESDVSSGSESPSNEKQALARKAQKENEKQQLLMA